jgi:ABC-type nitrate/sulfonate/bicarbonate transport system permease component
MMGVIGVVMYGAVVLLERWTVPWKKRDEFERIQGTA